MYKWRMIKSKKFTELKNVCLKKSHCIYTSVYIIKNDAYQVYEFFCLLNYTVVADDLIYARGMHDVIKKTRMTCVHVYSVCVQPRARGWTWRLRPRRRYITSRYCIIIVIKILYCVRTKDYAREKQNDNYRTCNTLVTGRLFEMSLGKFYSHSQRLFTVFYFLLPFSFFVFLAPFAFTSLTYYKL